MRMKKLIMLTIACLLSFGCSSDDTPGGIIVGGPTDGGDGGNNGGTGDGVFTYGANESLKNVVNFPIGNIVSAAKLASTSSENQTFKERLNEEYNSITAENDMKMANMFTAPGQYNFRDGDAIVAYAKANGLRVHGHALLWHSSIPGWIQNYTGTNEELLGLVEAYIKATVTHFAQEKMTVGGQEVSVVASWDVVNEGFETTGNNASFWRTRLGSDYIEKCFRWAREADANVKLFYNDFNIAGSPGKRATILQMVNNFKNNSVPIDGIGMQMHLNHDWPTSDLPTSIQEIANTGLLVHVSELDIKANYSGDISELTPERASAQEDQYQRAGYYYLTLVPQAQQFGLTIWGFRDRDSWLYDGGTDWPLLYNNDFEYKIAHRGLINGLKGEAVQ